MLTERTFNVFNKITADWDQIDTLIKNINNIDVNNTIENISISKLDVKDNILQNNFVLIICVNNYLDCDIEDKIDFKHLEILRPDMIPNSAIILWEKNQNDNT